MSKVYDNEAPIYVNQLGVKSENWFVIGINPRKVYLRFAFVKARMIPVLM
jgi:hypothetical protein